MRLRTLLLVSTALLLAVTCDKKKEEPEPQPQPPVTPKIEIPSESQAVFSQGISIQAGTQAQSQTVKFTATAAWSANVADTKASAWLSVQPSSGSAGSVTMTVTAQPNTTDKARSSTVTIQCGTVKQSFTVNQDAAVPQTVAVESVTLNKTELTLEPSGTETLTATVAPENATDKTVTWSTSNAEIASVADGKVTAVKEGEAIITAKAGDKQATCKVTVKKSAVPVQSVTLDRTSVTLEEGQTTTLTATISPNDADEQTITWTTSNAAAATVANGVVTAVAEGSAVIKASVGGKEASCTVTVQKKVIAVTEITLNKATLELKKGQSETLVATVAPDDATDKTVTWTTSNASVATVVDGLVTAVEEGTAIIQASAGDKTARCEVTVKAYQISVSPASLSFLSAGGSKDLKISCDGSWSISGQPSWCIPSTTTGTGDATIQLTVSANNDAKRTGSLTITCSGTTKTVAITQMGGGWQNQAFVHKSLYMMFTSVYCPYSDLMNEKIHQIDNIVGDKYHRVDVYVNSLGDADINYPDAGDLMALYYVATPSGSLDHRIQVQNWSKKNLLQETFENEIREQEDVYPPATGVSFTSSIAGRTLSVSGNVYSHEAETFRLTVYLLENQVEQDSKLYDNVLRKSLSNTLGDDFSIGSKNSTKPFQYSVDIPEGYNEENLYVLVIISRQYGQQKIIRTIYSGDYYVDNCRLAKVGEEAKLLVKDVASGGGNEGYDEGEEITF